MVVNQNSYLLYFLKRSRDQLKAHVLMYYHLLLSPNPSLVSNAIMMLTKSSACWRNPNGIVPVSPIGNTGSFTTAEKRSSLRRAAISQDISDSEVEET
jgi:hypothetical protein